MHHSRSQCAPINALWRVKSATQASTQSRILLTLSAEIPSRRCIRLVGLSRCRRTLPMCQRAKYPSVRPSALSTLDLTQMANWIAKVSVTRLRRSLAVLLITSVQSHQRKRDHSKIFSTAWSKSQNMKRIQQQRTHGAPRHLLSPQQTT